MKPNTAQFLREWRNLYESKSGERGIYNMDSVRKHIDKFGRRDSSRVAGTNPCGEILLRANQFCNLTEVVISAEDTVDTLSDKVRIATILGTWQSTLSNFKYIRKSWQTNTEEERLLGVSLTGIFGNELTGRIHSNLANILTDLRETAVAENFKESDLLGIEHSVAITTVKPSGTVSQLTGVSSGIHPWYSEYYIRSVRADNKDPLTMFLKDFGVPNEPDVMKPDATTVFYFPIKAPNKATVTKDLTAIEHLEIWKMYRTHWTEHNPSVTINVAEDEWLDVGAWVYNNFDSIGGVSFLPLSEHSYKQAPYQEITKEEYKAAVAAMPKNIPWQSLPLYELEDTTTGSQELACVAGACDVVDLVSA
jgi:ribonucleoside-diphosphate reductase alpha chain